MRNLIKAIKFRYFGVSQDELFALEWKKPEELFIHIEQSEGGYYARILNYESDNVSTWAENGKELVRMINEVLYDYLEIPVSCRSRYGYFFPEEEVRKKFSLEIPPEYLGENLKLVRS